MGGSTDGDAYNLTVLASTGPTDRSRASANNFRSPLTRNYTMSMLLRRSLLRAVPRTRGFAAAAGEGTYADKQAALKAHAGGMWNLNAPIHAVSFSCG